MWGIYGMFSSALSDKVIIFANGDIPTDDPTQGALKMAVAQGARVDHRRIKRLIDNGSGEHDGMSVEFEDGDVIKIGCMFHHPHCDSRARDLFEQLGVETTATNHRSGTGGEIPAKEFGKTNVPGIYAAGDTSTPHKSVPIAMSTGNVAGVGVAMELMTEKGIRALQASSQK